MSIAACKTAGGLLTARFFLGLPEAGVGQQPAHADIMA